MAPPNYVWKYQSTPPPHTLDLIHVSILWEKCLQKLSTSLIFSDPHISRLKNPYLLTQLTLDVLRVINSDNFDSEELGSFELYTS